jgi:hypothetical protein
MSEPTNPAWILHFAWPTGKQEKSQSAALRRLIAPAIDYCQFKEAVLMRFARRGIKQETVHF